MATVGKSPPRGGISCSALEAVTQDNRLLKPDRATGEGEGDERPRAALIVVGHRFKNRQHHVPALPERPRSRAKPDAVG